MEIILLEKVSSLGNLGDVVRVKDGYARNYLIPKKIARRATKNAIKEFEDKRIELEQIQLDKFNTAMDISTKLSGFQLLIHQKSSVDGRLFGSVTNSDVSEHLKKSGFDINKSQINLSVEHIKTIGEFSAKIKLHPDVVSEITILVSKENS
ncbi:50S ribosomal protein L9 [Candidatus Kinetoplastidibacterium crithidiae]|uniref:Large ribosomal subunit protein bL9 n=1 Tax=Candidatus Kinetoplastidibacterium crithidiae TCC036E TaxID=1208918 RepID=M1LWR9_9PROT|nr:50S ribosomal protein L9 [Candidatus Kinetoplastibacterium crithidii]AFZ82685.1 large subunit ribosomal protein L9 [Candidatus Kinetoplastibacterium crithidii (ex Angomonas deanei ATCC 30255)]AGF47659.1 large subunit ribosomal protein L9 [Candidatus Kinetoplastibacterium crithidii TCC036E]